MATFNGTNNADVANATNGGLVGFTGGTVAELQDATGDIFFGGGGVDRITSGAGDDSILPGPGVDFVHGGAGDDQIEYDSAGEIGSDLIDGGAHTSRDRLFLDFSGAADLRAATILSIEGLVLFAPGPNAVEIDAAQVSATGLSPTAQISVATGGSDVITFHNASSLGLAGFTFNGNWNQATDRIVVNGTAGNDVITGSPVADTINAGAGNDVITATGGADLLKGEAGSDTFVYNSAAAIGADTIDGGTDSGGFRDALQVVFTGVADFRTATIASAGSTSIEYLSLFGAGHDVRFNGAQVIATGLASNLTIQGDSAGADFVTFFDIEDLDLSGFQFSTWDETVDAVFLRGTASNDVLRGTGVRDIFFASVGEAGDDDAFGGGGNDDFFGSAGEDDLHGEAGDDSFVYNSGSELTGDLIDGGASSGVSGDQLYVQFAGLADFTGVTIASTGSTSIETLALFGAGHDVRFNAAQVSATGLASDLLIFGDDSGADIVTFQNAATTDFSDFRFEDWDQAADRIVINGTANGNGLGGTSVADTIVAGAGDDLIVGFAGADILRGEAGSDVFAYENNAEIAGDTIDGGADSGGFRDAIRIDFTGLADFTGATIASTGSTSIEFLALLDAGHDVRFNGVQVGATGLAANLRIQGDDAGADIVTFNDAASLNLGGFQFSQWNEAADRVVVNGTTGSNTLAGTSVADTINAGGGSDIFSGGGGDDALNGDGGGDFIDGGAGADAMNGGADFDTASWLASTPAGTGVTVNLTNQALNLGAAAGDRLANFENYYLTNAIDNFINNATGGYVYGFGGVDNIAGGAGVEIIDGGLGGDTLNGGAGFDYASWNSSATGVTVNLNTQAQNAGGAAGDIVSNFEAYFLSEQADMFTGVNNGASIIFGFGGADTLTDGTSANAWLFGGEGNDTLTGGALNDLLSGEGGNDVYHYNTWVGEGFDSILNFASGADRFRFTASNFGLAAGTTLNASNFIVAASPFATTAGPSFLYSSTLGILYFDLDGSGATFTAVALAQIAGAPTLVAGDFQFV